MLLARLMMLMLLLPRQAICSLGLQK